VARPHMVHSDTSGERVGGIDDPVREQCTATG
jgi:hypothetical protein